MYDITDERVEQTEMPDSMYEYGPESSVDMSEVMRQSLYKTTLLCMSAKCLIIFIGIQVSLK